MELIDSIDHYDYYDPEGEKSLGIETYTEPADSPLGQAISRYIQKDRWVSLYGDPKLTVNKRWSGYSEYTITSTWDAIKIEWGVHTLEFDSMAEFFRKISETSEESQDY